MMMAIKPSIPLTDEQLERLADAGDWSGIAKSIGAMAESSKTDAAQAKRTQDCYTAYAPRMIDAKAWECVFFSAAWTASTFASPEERERFSNQQEAIYLPLIAADGRWSAISDHVILTITAGTTADKRMKYAKHYLAKYGQPMAEAGAIEPLCNFIRMAAITGFDDPASRIQFVLTQAAAFTKPMLAAGEKLGSDDDNDPDNDDRDEEPLVRLLTDCLDSIEDLRADKPDVPFGRPRRVWTARPDDLVK